jgi:hypothetical protein
MAEQDPLEAIELERTADWRISKLGENPRDTPSAAAATLLQKLADDIRALQGSPAYAEYQAICGMAELGDYAQAYRSRIGIDQFPADGEAYLRVLIGFAKNTFGSP